MSEEIAYGNEDWVSEREIEMRCAVVLDFVWLGFGAAFRDFFLVSTYMAWSFHSPTPIWGRIDIMGRRKTGGGVLRSLVLVFLLCCLYWVVVLLYSRRILFIGYLLICVL